MDSWIKRSVVVAALIVDVMAGCANAADDRAPSLGDLSGNHRFHIGDDERWVAPDFDDSVWRTIAVPATWVSQGAAWTDFRGCYRIRFQYPVETFGERIGNHIGERQDREIGLSLGVVLGAHEVWLNGVRIGGAGTLGDRFTEVPWQRFVHRVPRELLRTGNGTGQDNVLVVRCQHFLQGGILDGPLAIGDFYELSAEVERRARVEWQCEAVMFAFYVIGFLFWLVVWLNGVRDREYVWLLAMLVSFAAAGLYESRSFFATGWRMPVLERGYVLLSSSVIPIVATRFFQVLFHRPTTRAIQGIWGGIAFLSLLGLLPTNLRLVELATFVWLALVVVLQGFVLAWSWRAFRDGIDEALPLLVGLVVGNSLLSLSLIPAFGSYWIGGIGLWNYALAAFLLSGMIAMVQRYVRLRNRLQWVSSRTLQAHEDERKRLARELHDGVAQSVLAIQLNLEMIRARVRQGKVLDDEALDQLVDETRATSQELRRVARDLRPEAIERMSLTDAMRWLAEQVQSRTSLRITVASAAEVDVATTVKDHLYRIAQEALKNVVTHAHAAEVTINVARHETLIELTITDNGRGFDSRAVQTGLGLASLHERAELLGGTAQVDSSPGQGTTIRVTVPV